MEEGGGREDSYATFVDENDVKFPDDPMGSHGPKLDQFLSF